MEKPEVIQLFSDGEMNRAFSFFKRDAAFAIAESPVMSR